MHAEGLDDTGLPRYLGWDVAELPALLPGRRPAGATFTADVQRILRALGSLPTAWRRRYRRVLSRKAFDVVEVDDNAVFIRPHDTATPYSPRRIQRRSIEEACCLSRAGQALTPSMIQKAERLPRDAAYSAAYLVTIATKLTQ